MNMDGVVLVRKGNGWVGLLSIPHTLLRYRLLFQLLLFSKLNRPFTTNVLTTIIWLCPKRLFSSKLPELK